MEQAMRMIEYEIIIDNEYASAIAGIMKLIQEAKLTYNEKRAVLWFVLDGVYPDRQDSIGG